MPQPKNHFLRIFIPTVLIVVAVGLSIMVFRATTRKPAPADLAAAPSGSTSTPDAAPSPLVPPFAALPGADVPTVPPDGTASIGSPGTVVAPAASASQSPAAALPVDSGAAIARANFFVRSFPATEAPVPAELGSLDPQLSAKQRLVFSQVGAGIDRLDLANHFDTIKDGKHVAVQETLQLPGGGEAQIPFSAFQIAVAEEDQDISRVLWINIRSVPNAGQRVWRAVPGGAAGEFEAFIVDAGDAPALRLHRAYSISPGSYDIVIRQRVENQSGRPLRFVWQQFGPTELHQDAKSYGGDKRKMRFGYLLDPSRDPSRSAVVSGDHELDHSKILGEPETKGTQQVVWPTKDSATDSETVAWAGVTNRYFGVAMHSLFDLSLTTPDKTLGWVETITTIIPPSASAGSEYASVIVTSKPLLVVAGGTADVSMGLYAGPMDRRLIRSEPLLAGLNLHQLVVYNFGGMCGWCTFGWMTQALLGLLHMLHDYIFRDWSLAIIFLVVIVRTVLHPVTRWSQIRMQRFGKQMQAVGPKQKILQEKYTGDPKKLQEETAKLWREEGISPAGMLGCIPMFLQTPVWIALYAVLYFAVELRHEHAFFGLFQNIQPQSSPFWWFLGDLAEPDRFWFFAENSANPWEIPLLGPLTSLNILPLILGVVFFIQQKYLTPPTAATLTPEQEMQQKMIKWMTVFMFPLFMYNAPSGLALYFIANSTLGILESRWIRSHITKNDLLTPAKKPVVIGSGKSGIGKPAPVGFMARMQALAEQKQREALEKGRRTGKKR